MANHVPVQKMFSYGFVKTVAKSLQCNKDKSVWDSVLFNFVPFYSHRHACARQAILEVEINYIYLQQLHT